MGNVCFNVSFVFCGKDHVAYMFCVEIHNYLKAAGMDKGTLGISFDYTVMKDNWQSGCCF